MLTGDFYEDFNNGREKMKRILSILTIIIAHIRIFTVKAVARWIVLIREVWRLIPIRSGKHFPAGLTRWKFGWMGFAKTA